jgi:hypothetical protein
MTTTTILEDTKNAWNYTNNNKAKIRKVIDLTKNEYKELIELLHPEIEVAETNELETDNEKKSSDVFEKYIKEIAKMKQNMYKKHDSPFHDLFPIDRYYLQPDDMARY